MKSAIPRALGARGSLLRVAQGAVAGKEGKETSGLVSGNRRGFMHKPRGLLIQPPQRRCLSSSTLVMPPPRVPPATTHRQAVSPGLLSCPPCGVASGAFHHPIGPRVLSVWAPVLGRGPAPTPFPCPDCSFHGLVFTCWLGGCIEHSWLIVLDPVLMKSLEFCSDTRCGSALSHLLSFLGSWCLCSNT